MNIASHLRFVITRIRYFYFLPFCRYFIFGPYQNVVPPFQRMLKNKATVLSFHIHIFNVLGFFPVAYTKLCTDVHSQMNLHIFKQDSSSFGKRCLLTLGSTISKAGVRNFTRKFLLLGDGTISRTFLPFTAPDAGCQTVRRFASVGVGVLK